MASPVLYPIGIENFKDLRTGGYLYVDKTEFIHRLVSQGKYYLLCRPRRFGKSLFLSTMEAFFRGEKELFEGLAITRYDHDWKACPVFHLNFVGLDTSSTEGLESLLSAHFEEWENLYGKTTPGLMYPQRFYQLIQNAYRQTGMKVVVLVDEYDKPLLSNLGDEGVCESFRNILKPFYGILKRADAYIRFACLTGVTRFSRLSIFSDMNNLDDISVAEDYSTVCGITEDEIKQYCREGVQSLSERMGKSEQETMEILKRNYDGYHFSAGCPDLYNPYSLLNALRHKEIGEYWYGTGTPTFLVRALRNSDAYIPEILHDEADSTELARIDSYRDSAIGILFQTGYLTIKGYNPQRETYNLGLPNREVASGFFKDLLPQYMDIGLSRGLKEIRSFVDCVERGDPQAFLERLRAFLAGIPYDLTMCKPEIYFENNLFIIFKLMGFQVHSEFKTSSGRIDLLLTTDKYIYVMELKLDGSPESALLQIDKKEYCLPFTTDRRKIFKIGISFSKKTRNIGSWMIK